MRTEVKYDLDKIFRMFTFVLVLAFLLFLFYYLRNILVPFVVAFIIAYMLDPLADIFEKYLRSRVAAVIVVFVVFGGIIFMLFFFGVPYVYNELVAFGEVFPQYMQDIYQFTQEKLPSVMQGENSSEYFKAKFEDVVQNIETTSLIQNSFGYVSEIFSKIMNLFILLAGVVIVLMYVFFLLRDIDRIKERWTYYIPEKYRVNTKSFLSDVNFYTTQFFRGQLTIVAILCVFFSIGFSIVDIRLSIIFGFTAGILNLVPNFGTIVAIFPAVILAIGRAAEDGSDPLMRIGGILLVFTVIQLIQEIVLTPVIMGKRTGLRPATILFSVLIWGKLLGFLGIILAIPLTCITKVYFARYILKNEIKDLPQESKNNVIKST